MVARHCTIPYEFVCLTDDARPIDGVRLIVQPSGGYPKLWWQKVHMFDPMLDVGGRILYFDLDVIIHANIDKLAQGTDKDFYGIRDFNRKFHPGWNVLNSSVMCWQKGMHPDIFSTFMTNPKKAMKMHGDQDWIWAVAKSRITFYPDEWIMSYKWELRDRTEISRQNGITRFKTVRSPKIPKENCVAVFHGDPNPPDIQDQFVVDNWR